MRAISLWQPWATAIAVKSKRVETRSWQTNYVGMLAIHAAKRWTRDEQEFAAMQIEAGHLPAIIPLGKIVAIARLDGCRRTEDVEHQLGDVERSFGNYAPGRWAWFLSDIRAIVEPIPFKGAQGFFNVPDVLFADIQTKP